MRSEIVRRKKRKVRFSSEKGSREGREKKILHEKQLLIVPASRPAIYISHLQMPFQIRSFSFVQFVRTFFSSNVWDSALEKLTREGSSPPKTLPLDMTVSDSEAGCSDCILRTVE